MKMDATPSGSTGYLLAAAFLLAGMLSIPDSHAQGAASLRAKEAALRDQLAKSPFRRPLVLESAEAKGALSGDVYAVVSYPYEMVGRALSSLDHWCDILLLQFNVKDCRARGNGGGTLSIAVARKSDDPSSDVHQVDLGYRVASATSDYLAVQLGADAGPLGTKNYRIMLEAIPLDAKRSFVHLSYSYSYGAAARIAMKDYLSTSGRDKVGFSVVGRQPDGTPTYIGGERGVIERNSMRYYLAIEAHLGAYGLPAAQRAEKRLNDWFTAVERYPRQLHEMEREQYLAMKRKDLARRQTASTSAN
jgi:hypothetical protein